MARKNTDLALILSALCCLGIVVSGCQKDDIQAYVAPKAVEVKEAPPEGDGPKERMLAAVIPHGDEVWFLKMQAPEQIASAHKAEFDQVLHSFRFLDQKDKPVAWTTPPGWKTEPPSKMRYATLVLDVKDATLELSITRLPGGGNVVANINRWRQQLGLNPVVATDISKVTKQVKLDSGTAVAIDFVGVAQKSAAMARGHDRPPQEPTAPPIQYTLPNGWTPLPVKGGPMSPLASFQVAEGNQEATVSISSPLCRIRKSGRQHRPLATSDRVAHGHCRRIEEQRSGIHGQRHPLSLR